MGKYIQHFCIEIRYHKCSVFTFFQILWKSSRCNILVSFPSHLKKLSSILRFLLEKLNCGFFHSFHSRKNTTKQLSSQNFSVENNYSLTINRSSWRKSSFSSFFTKNWMLLLKTFLDKNAVTYYNNGVAIKSDRQLRSNSSQMSTFNF